MSLHPKAEADLEWWFGQTVFSRSTFGATLERQQNRYYDSAGRVVPKADPMTHRVIKEPHAESGYEPDLGATARHGRLSRRIAHLGRVDLRVLELYYGNAGARWAGQRLGRIWCLAAVTPAGQRELARIRAEREEAGQPDLGLTDAETLANEAERQTLAPSDRRRRVLQQIRDESDVLLVAAQQAWRGTRDLEIVTARARPDRWV